MGTDNIQQYDGIWRIYDDEKWYQGVLYVDIKNRYIYLTITMPWETDKKAPHLPYIGKLKYINGILSNKSNMLLYDCTIMMEGYSYGKYAQQNVIANYCFCGINVKDENEIIFKNVSIDFGEIIEWSGLCKYETKLDDSPLKTSFIWTSKEPVESVIRDGVKVVFSPCYSSKMFSTSSETILKQGIDVGIEYSIPKKWEEIVDDILCLRYFIGFGMNRAIGIKEIHYLHPSSNYEVPGDNGIELYPEPVELWLGNGDKVITRNRNKYECNFTLEESVEYHLLEMWGEIYSKLKPVLDLLFSETMNSITVQEVVFLNLMQALETFHARFVSNDKSEYIAKVDRIVDSFCQDSVNKEEWKLFLANEKQRDVRCRNIFLRSRLAYLIFAEGEMPFHIYHFAKHEDLIRKLVDTRNYYTHYDEKSKNIFSHEELSWINDHLIRLLTYHILIQIGYDREKAKEQLINKGRLIDDTESIYNIGRRDI